MRGHRSVAGAGACTARLRRQSQANARKQGGMCEFSFGFRFRVGLACRDTCSSVRVHTLHMCMHQVAAGSWDACTCSHAGALRDRPYSPHVHVYTSHRRAASQVLHGGDEWTPTTPPHAAQAGSWRQSGGAQGQRRPRHATRARRQSRSRASTPFPLTKNPPCSQN